MVAEIGAAFLCAELQIAGMCVPITLVSRAVAEADEGRIPARFSLPPPRGKHRRLLLHHWLN
ncbi:hypothetical protein IVB44_06625 [Bradyrhizobium sp. 49]|nr:hypothetical protein [Bradyrhizobium sp. 84]MCK1370725.1 hypothetical protein [Bradyrhizobium sp. 49]